MSMFDVKYPLSPCKIVPRRARIRNRSKALTICDNVYFFRLSSPHVNGEEGDAERHDTPPYHRLPLSRIGR